MVRPLVVIFDGYCRSRQWSRLFCSHRSMGARQSTAQSQPPTKGLHVLRVTQNSPASYSDIQPFFDFVTGFEGDAQSSSDKPIDISELEKILERHENRTLNLLIWNSKS